MGFGAMQLPGPGVWGPPRDPAAALATVRRAYQLGVRLFDTAWYYGPGTANRVLREALQPYADDIVLVTKLGGSRGDGGSWITSYHYDKLRAGAERDLTQLDVDMVGVAQLRWTRTESSGGVRFEDAVETMARLRQDGLIRAIGLSEVSRAQLDIARTITDIVTVSNAYNILQRADDSMIAKCSGLGVAYLPFFPLGSGALHAAPGLAAIATRTALTPSQLALAWLLARDPSIVVIAGTSRATHVEENVAAAAITLSAHDLDALNGLA